MYIHHTWHMGIWLPILIVTALLVLAFEIWMVVDAAINKKLSDTAKAWWIVGMFIVHPLVAIVYFFTSRRKR